MDTKENRYPSRKTKVTGRDLRHAAFSGDVQAVKSYLSNRLVNVDAFDPKNRTTALHHATAKGYTQIVSLLIDYGASIDQTDTDGCTPLHTAAFYGHSDSVNLLIEAGANPLHRDIDDCVPLHKAAYSGSLECGELICMALPDYKSHVKKKSGLDVADKEKIAPLHRAAFHNHFGLVKFLVDSGSNVNTLDMFYQTPLHRAAYTGNVTLVDFLIKSGASIASQDAAGLTPLMIAASEGHSYLCHFLLQQGADIEATTTHNLWTATHFAANSGSLECLYVLLLDGAITDREDNQGRTPLFYAVQNEHSDVVYFLLKMGAHPTKLDKEGTRPIDIAAKEVSTVEVVNVFKEVRREVLDISTREDEISYGVTEWITDHIKIFNVLNYLKNSELRYKKEIILMKIKTLKFSQENSVGRQLSFHRVLLESKVIDVKEMIFAKYGIPTDVVRLFWVKTKSYFDKEALTNEGLVVELEDDKPLEEYWGNCGYGFSPDILITHQFTERINVLEEDN